MGSVKLNFEFNSVNGSGRAACCAVRHLTKRTAEASVVQCEAPICYTDRACRVDNPVRSACGDAIGQAEKKDSVRIF